MLSQGACDLRQVLPFRRIGRYRVNADTAGKNRLFTQPVKKMIIAAFILSPTENSLLKSLGN